MAVNLSSLAGAGQQFFDNNGKQLSGGKLYSYAAGTTTPLTTYTTVAGNVAHANPIVLDSAGRIATGEIWVTAGLGYKFVLKTANDVTLATWDNITGINGTGITSNASTVQYDPTTGSSTTVQSKLRSLELTNYTALRAFTGTETHVQIVADGISGLFRYDPIDTTSTDNGGTVIVGSDGRRWKRVFDGSVNASWFGAGNIQNAIAVTEQDNALTLSSTYSITNSLNIDGYDSAINGMGYSKVHQATPDKSVFLFTSGNAPSVIACELTQVDSSNPGTGSANNHGVIRFDGSVGPIAAFNKIGPSSLGVRFSENTSGNMTKFGISAFNHIDNFEKMGVETLKAAYSKIVGNSLNSARYNSGGYRLSGYTTEGTSPDFAELRCKGVVAAANVAVGGDTNGGVAITYQNSVIGACFSSFYAEGARNAIRASLGTSIESSPRSSIFQFSAIDCRFPIVNNGSSHTIYDFSIGHVQGGVPQGTGIEEVSSTTHAGKNIYRGVINYAKDRAAGAPLRLAFPGTAVDVTFDHTDNSVAARIEGDYTTGRISGFDFPNVGVTIAANYCNINITLDNSGGTSNIIISGSNNTVTCNTGKGVQITGSQNVILGRVSGVVRFDGNNNKFIGVASGITDNGTGNSAI